MAGRRFDALLHMQLAIRASLAAALVPARGASRLRPRARARAAVAVHQRQRIAPRSREHVLDSLFGFAERARRAPAVDALGHPAARGRRSTTRGARFPDGQPTLVMSPCSSHALRNWSPERYAAVADHAAARHGLRVLVCGGRSDSRCEYGARIAALMRSPCVNLVGKDTLLEFLATLQRATALLSPDSGPAHMATAVGTPVIGLYAATNPARSGPYYSRAVVRGPLRRPRPGASDGRPRRANCPGPPRSRSPA